MSREWPQQRLFKRPIVADAGRPVTHAACIIGVIGCLQQCVELLDRVDDWHGHAVVTAKPPALAFHAALLVAAFMSWLAIPGFKTVVRAERDPALVFLPGAPEQHLLDRAVEFV